MFVRKKVNGSSTYYYLVESRRLSGKVVQETIAYMSTHATIEAAYQHWKKIAQQRYASPIEKLRAKLNMEALSEHRPTEVVAAEEQKRDKARQKREATPASNKRRAAQARVRGIGLPGVRESRADHLRVLGLDAHATYSYSEIKSAYRRLAREHHPDRSGDAAAFRLVNEAYAALTGRQ